MLKDYRHIPNTVQDVFLTEVTRHSSVTCFRNFMNEENLSRKRKGTPARKLPCQKRTVIVYDDEDEDDEFPYFDVDVLLDDSDEENSGAEVDVYIDYDDEEDFEESPLV